MLMRGSISIILSYERMLPLLALGFVLALMRPWQAAIGAACAVLGLWLGFAARDWLIAAVVSGPATVRRLALPGPIACLAAGLILAAPAGLRSWLLPLAAIVIGAMLALGIKLVDPSFHDPNFLRGAVATITWLVAGVALTGHLRSWPWFRIAIRILGSWLIAIGLMLGASILVPRPTVSDIPEQPPEGFERQGSPDIFRRPAGADRPQSPFARPGLDRSTQP